MNLLRRKDIIKIQWIATCRAVNDQVNCRKMEYSSRHVTMLCREGRFEGAITNGSMWLIPCNLPIPIGKNAEEKQDRR